MQHIHTQLAKALNFANTQRFRDGNGIFKFAIDMYHPDNGQRSYKPQTKHAERMLLPSSSQKHSRTYHWVRGSWETDRRKSRISSSSSSFFFFLIQNCWL